MAGRWGTGGWGTGPWGGGVPVPGPPGGPGSPWGTGWWGTGTWGGVTGAPPVIGAVETKLCDTKGGTVLGLFGLNFADPTVIELVDNGTLEVLAKAYYFEASLDLREHKILAGFPALPVGSYGVKLTTPYGATPVLLNAVTYADYAEPGKVQRVRRRFGEAWATGKKLLA